jgi:hypothetical protein
MVNYVEMSKYKYPFHILLHPVDGYQELKYNKKGSFSFALAIVLFWYITAVSVKQIQEFAFNSTRPGHLNIFIVAATTILVYFMVVVSNWCFSTLMDGKGTFKEICVVCSYALLPMIIASWIRIVLSQFLVVEEGVFIQYIDYIAYIWTGILLFLALSTVHEFTFPKTIEVIALTILGMLAILFLCVLIYTLYQQIAMFCINIFYEIIFRFFS